MRRHNESVDMDYRDLQRRRDALLRGAGISLALALAAIGIGCFPSLAEAIAPKPDYYRILMAELAREHFLATNTPTVVKEEAETLEFFGSQYDVRSKHLGSPPAEVFAPREGMLSFSYLAGVMDLRVISEEVLQREDTNPSATLVMPPLAFWVYSKQEGLMACFSCVIVDRALLNNPPPWLDLNNLQTVDWSGVVSAEGPFPNGEFIFVPIHADLLPFGDLKLENLDSGSKQDPDLRRFDRVLPLAYFHGPKIQPPRVSGEKTIARLRSAAAFPVRLIRWSSRFLILPAGLSWLFLRLWGLRELRRRYCSAMRAKDPGTQRPARISFFRFLASRDLEGWQAETVAEARAMQYLSLVRRREECERREMIDELREYRSQLDLVDDEVGRFDEVLNGGSTEELRRLRDMYRPVIERRIEELEKERQRLREREREIRWLESEIETIPLEKRENEAREAWALYERARASSDQSEKLRWLKEARKRVPRGLRPDRF